MSDEKPKRCWYRFSLRTLLLAMTLFAAAVACAKIVNDLLDGIKAGPMFVIMGIGVMVIGVLLSLFYAVKFFIDVKNNDPDGNWLGGFGGWASGSLFVGGGLVFVLPSEALWLVIPIAVVWLACWWPVAFVIRRCCST
jgi:hypothetical protein